MNPADYAKKAQTDSVIAINLLKASLAVYLGVQDQFNTLQQIHFVQVWEVFLGRWKGGSREVMLLLI